MTTLTETVARLGRRILDPNPPTTTRTPTGWPGLYLGMGRYGPVHAGGQHHAMVIGPPRSGKTTRLIVPNLIAHPGAAVATTTKADLVIATAEARTRRGTCWLWDPTATIPVPPSVRPLRWSPVLGCHDWDQAVARAHALAGAARPDHSHRHDSHWVERAQAILAPLLHAAALADTNLAAVLSWLHRRHLDEPLEILDHADADLAHDVLTGVAATDPRERSGIFSTADSLLAAYRSRTALDATRHPTFDPDQFAAGTDTIYLAAPGTTQSQHAPLVVALLDQIRTSTYRRRPATPILWALDELAHIAPLPDLPATVAEGASQGIVILAALQDLSQARTRWGAAADGFLTLFTRTIALPGIADLPTLRQLSALAGHIDQPVPSTHPNGHLFGTTTSWSIQQRPRLDLDQAARGRPGLALIATRGHLSYVRL